MSNSLNCNESVFSGGSEIEMTNEKTSTQQKLVVKLEENAMDSLVHGVEHHLYGRRNTDWKYVILHVFHAVELFLKARLAKHDESLIYRSNGNTVGADEAIELLVKKAKLFLFQYAELQESGKYKGKYKLGGALDALRIARNSIEHKEIALNPDEVQEVFSISLDTLLNTDITFHSKQRSNGIEVIAPVWEIHPTTHLWGATAMILNELLWLYKEFKEHFYE